MKKKDRAKQVDQQHQKAKGAKAAKADDRAGARRPAERSEERSPNAAPPPVGKPGDV